MPYRRGSRPIPQHSVYRTPADINPQSCSAAISSPWALSDPHMADRQVKTHAPTLYGGLPARRFTTD